MATLFAYVDESGKDLRATFFVVSVMVTDSSREKICQELKQIEKQTKKGNRKWRRAHYLRRREYIEQISRLKSLQNKIFFERFPKENKYLEFTADATAHALQQKRPDKVIVFVDGLPKGQVPAFKRQLKPSIKKPTKVSGVQKEENNEFIRLVDAMCGAIRDSYEGDEWAKTIIRRLRRHDILTELKP